MKIGRKSTPTTRRGPITCRRRCDNGVIRTKNGTAICGVCRGRGVE